MEKMVLTPRSISSQKKEIIAQFSVTSPYSEHQILHLQLSTSTDVDHDRQIQVNLTNDVVSLIAGSNFAIVDVRLLVVSPRIRSPPLSRSRAKMYVWHTGFRLCNPLPSVLCVSGWYGWWQLSFKQASTITVTL